MIIQNLITNRVQLSENLCSLPVISSLKNADGPSIRLLVQVDDGREFEFGFPLNSHGTRRLYPHDTTWQCTAKIFIMACFDAHLLNLT